MKLTFKEIVTQRLSAAPESVAKAELIEELSENLYCRYEDLLASGVEPEDAQARAVDALGDTDELVVYLKSLEPDQPLPELVLDPDKGDGSQIDEILHNVEDILRGAFHKAKSAFKEAKNTVKDGFEAEVSVKGDVHTGDGEVEEFSKLEANLDEAEVELLEEEENGEPSKGWKVTYQSKNRNVELNSDELKESVKDMMKDIEKVIRDATGAAKTVAKDACKTAKEAAEKVCEDVSAACTPDTAVEADQPIDAVQLKAIDVQTFGGDITVRMSQAPDGDVLVGGDIEDIEVFRSADGVLTIRPVKTETSVFFFGRGIFNSSSSADVVLDLPCRDWESLKLSTTNGDVDVSGTNSVNRVMVSSVSGDIRGDLLSCARVTCRTTNGDITWNGDASEFRVESISGDVQFRGQSDSVTATTTRGDLTVEGSICVAAIRTISGDVCLRSRVLPDRMDIGTTSGDMWVDIPDGGPFTARFRSTSGDFTSDFFTGRMGGRSCVFNYQGGGECMYTFASVSGDVEIRKYH